MKHIPILTNELFEGLALETNDVVLDATVGSGGHVHALKEKYPDMQVIALDTDPNSLSRSQQRLRSFQNISFVQANFRTIAHIELPHHPTKIYADLGYSSDQLENPERGLSFKLDGPLDMRLARDTQTLTADMLIHTLEEEDLIPILRNYGEERYAKRIAHAIVTRRQEKPFETTGELAEHIKSIVPGSYRKGRIHPATRTFQALRIAVNDELDTLRDFITGSLERLPKGGRLAIISFHSLEDRIVKHMFREYAKDHNGEVITKKPITPSYEEIAVNPRSRSAKLRILQK